MDAGDEVVFEFLGVIRQYRSGRVERLHPLHPVPPSLDAATGVASRDVTVDPATGLWVRLYLPDLSACAAGARRLPVVLYLHGGGLVTGSAADAPEHAFLNRLAARAGALAVSVEYRLAPEQPVPACYDDAWAALRWVIAAASTTDDVAADPWVRDHADLDRVSVLGFSAGGNIAHNVTLRAGGGGGDGAARVSGMALLHPYFLSSRKTDGEVKNAYVRGKLEETWPFACGGRTTGIDDPRVNPVADGAPSLRAALGCARVLVCVADDELEARGKAYYYDGLLASGWTEDDDAELLDSAGQPHEFHLTHPDCPQAQHLMDRLVALILGGKQYKCRTARRGACSVGRDTVRALALDAAE